VAAVVIVVGFLVGLDNLLSAVGSHVNRTRKLWATASRRFGAKKARELARAAADAAHAAEAALMKAEAEASARAEAEAQAKLEADAEADQAAEAARVAEAARQAEAAKRAEADTIAANDRRHEELSPLLDVEYHWLRNERTQRMILKAEVVNRSPREYQGIASIRYGSGGIEPKGSVKLTPSGSAEVFVMSEDDSRPIALEIELDCAMWCPCGRGTHTRRHFQVDRELSYRITTPPPPLPAPTAIVSEPAPPQRNHLRTSMEQLKNENPPQG
jgi:hypothetical protein